MSDSLACARSLALRCSPRSAPRIAHAQTDEPPLLQDAREGRQAAADGASGCRRRRSWSTSTRRDWTTGRYGGDLRMLMAKDRDIRMMVVYGYARLVGYDEKLRFVPDILESFENVGDRDVHVPPAPRPPLVGRRSRSPPTTSATTGRTSPTTRRSRRSACRMRCWSTASGPRVTFPDATTVALHVGRAESAVPAGARRPESPLFLYRPAHYLQAVPREVHRRGQGEGAGHGGQDAQLGRPASQEGRAVPVRQSGAADARAVDQHDAAADDALRAACAIPISTASTRRAGSCRTSTASIINLADEKLVPAKTGTGDVDLQARYLRFDDYTFLKRNEKRSQLQGAALGDGQGLADGAATRTSTPTDPAWRELLRDVRFRRALSLGDQPARDQRGRLLRPRAAVEQHGAAAKPAVRQDLPRRLDEVRPQGRERAARRDGPHRARRAAACA